MPQDWESRVLQCRQKQQWDDAYAILTPMLATVQGVDLAHVKVQLAATRFAESPETAVDDLTLTDEALATIHLDSEYTARALLTGLSYALYASDTVRAKSYLGTAKEFIAAARPEGIPWHGRLLTEMAYYYQEQQKYERATVCLTESVAFYNTNTGPYGKADCLCQLRLNYTALGEIHWLLGKRRIALDYLREAVALATDKAPMVVAYLKGRMAWGEGRTAAAVAYLQDAIDTAWPNDHRFKLRVVEALAAVYRENKQWAALDALLTRYREEARKGRLVSNLLRLQRLSIRTESGEVAGW